VTIKNIEGPSLCNNSFIDFALQVNQVSGPWEFIFFLLDTIK